MTMTKVRYFKEKKKVVKSVNNQSLSRFSDLKSIILDIGSKAIWGRYLEIDYNHIYLTKAGVI